MSRFHSRIGAKLALSALIGVLLVVAMIGNQARVNRLARDLAGQVEAGETLERAAFEAQIALDELVGSDREIRLAATSEVLKSVMQDVANHTAAGNKAYAVAVGKAEVTKDLEGLDFAKNAFNAYSATAGELAGIQKSLIELREQQIAEGLEWAKKLNLLVNHEGVVGAPNRFSLLVDIKDADSAFQQARLEFWSRFTRRDDTQMDRLHVHLDETVHFLTAVRDRIVDPDAADLFEQLLAFPPRYKGIVDKLTVATEAQANLLRTRAGPLHNAADARMSEVKHSVSKRVDQLNATSSTELRRAEQVNFLTGGFVILVLAGSAVFSTIAIGRPIQHIGKVLTQLAGGNKTVQIPYAERSDEIGVAARAAKTFKEYLLRMDRLEAEHKESETRTASERKAEMDQFCR